MKEFFPQIEYFVYKTCTDKWELPEKTIQFYDLTFVLEGSATYYIDKQRVDVKQGQAVFVKKGQLRAAKTGFMVCAAFNFDVLDRSNISIPCVTEWENAAEILMYIKEFNAEWLRHQTGFMIKCSGIFMLMVHRLLYGYSNESHNVTVENMKKYIEENYKKPINVLDISNFVCLNKVYSGALFKKHMNMTITEYLHRIRVEHAAQLLKIGEFNVTQVAFQTGFNDLYYFSKIFKKYKGISPKFYK